MTGTEESIENAAKDASAVGAGAIAGAGVDPDNRGGEDVKANGAAGIVSAGTVFAAGTALTALPRGTAMTGVATTGVAIIGVAITGTGPFGAVPAGKGMAMTGT
jgi:hypothetical protein